MNSTKYRSRIQAPFSPDLDSLHIFPETNDGPSLNPTGQDLPDRSDSRSPTNTNSIIKCRKPSVYSTFNVRAINHISRLHDLTAIANSCYIDVMSMQEHRFFHPDSDLEYLKQTDTNLSQPQQKELHKCHHWRCGNPVITQSAEQHPAHRKDLTTYPSCRIQQQPY